MVSPRGAHPKRRSAGPRDAGMGVASLLARNVRAGLAMEPASLQPSNVTRRGWPLIGLFLVLAFLTHDLIMAGDVHASPAHSADNADRSHAEHVALAHTSLLDQVDSMTAGRISTPEECDVVRQIAALQDAGRQSLQRHDLVLSRLSFDRPPASPFEWPDGDRARAPNVRRALLQVYRI
ncbi:MAG: hypothetical protein IT336_15195 [Thermomicrobiales bacterium]|nr:hypothetical protein [Thermomicrobiales bacterium]